MRIQTRFTLRDVGREAAAGLLQRPGRSLVTALGTVLGIAMFVGVIGLASTASGQVSARFTALAATEVELKTTPDQHHPLLLPGNADTLVRRIDGVIDAGVWWHGPATPVTAHPGLAGSFEPDLLDLVGASPGFFDAAGATWQAGRGFDAFAQDRGLRVAVVGSAAAAQLGLPALDGGPVTITVNEESYLVAGILSDLQRHPELLLSVIVPTTTARADLEAPVEENMVVRTRVGAARVVAGQVAVALRPEAPDTIQVAPPLDPRRLGDQVATDLDGLFVALALVSLVVGGLSIATTALVSVLERTPEIGLRRALGARRRHIAAQFLAEGGLLGLLGGLVGGSIGVGVVVLAAIAERWTALIAPWSVLAAPVLGGLIGLVATAYPAWRASRVRPVVALQR